MNTDGVRTGRGKVGLYPSKEELERVFSQLDTADILQRLSAGDLTPLATDVARAEIAARKEEVAPHHFSPGEAKEEEDTDNRLLEGNL
jgi:hypothetical protein